MPFSKTQEILTDKGYQGIKSIFPRAKIPHKKPKEAELTTELKELNKILGKQRIFVETLIVTLKVFVFYLVDIEIKERNFHFGGSLIAGIYNFQRSLFRFSNGGIDNFKLRLINQTC